MNWNRIFGIIVRYWYSWRHNLDRLTDSFYWPAMDLLLWGLTSLYIKNTSTDFPQIVLVLISGLIFWMVIWKSQYEITTNLLQEIWDKNLVNIFAAPLTIAEWVGAVMIMGVIKVVITISFASLLAFFLYAFNIFIYGIFILPFFFSLVLTGWAAGFVVAGLIMRYGFRIQALAWAGVYILAPFSAIYFPVSLLPIWAQKIAAIVPSSYIFEGMREVLFTGQLSFDKLIISIALNLIYLVLSIMFFVYMYNKSRTFGLGRLI